MTVLELNFPAGRYHATPWGRHVNEGAVEWWPSPWRIVRALIATWYLKAREIPEDTVRSLVSALSHPPIFWLPRATTAHTRHYMPNNEGKNEKTTKVFDTFIQIAENDSVFVAWDVELPSDQLKPCGNSPTASDTSAALKVSSWRGCSKRYPRRRTDLSHGRAPEQWHAAAGKNGTRLPADALDVGAIRKLA